MSTVRITGAGSLDRLAVRVEGADAKLLAQTLNRAMAPTATKVRRELASTTGAGYGRVSQVVTPRKASASLLTYRVDAKDGWMSLRDFKSRQTRRGVSAAPWGDRMVFPHSFIVKKYGGHTFVRIGTASGHTVDKLEDYGIKGFGRFPIRKLFGPNIPREMVRPDGAPLEAWQQDVGQLAPRILREVKRRLEAGG